jgi:hypothetical protein
MNYVIQPAGFVPDKELFDRMAHMFSEMRDKNINVDFSDEEGKTAGAKGEDKGAW